VKRVTSLANGMIRAMTSASVAASIFGQSWLGCLVRKQAIKQVDRLLSTRGIVLRDMFAPCIVEVVGQPKAIVVAMGGTDLDAEIRRRWP
jgi:hypothetical protein